LRAGLETRRRPNAAPADLLVQPPDNSAWLNLLTPMLKNINWKNIAVIAVIDG
jgi:hypothetical protein